MTNGIWVSPDQFVQFGEKTKTFNDHIVTRDRSPDFTALGNYLPNPDPILKAKGKDVSIYRDLRSHAAVGGAIRRRKAAVKSLEFRVERGNATARTARNIKDIIDDIDIAQFIDDTLDCTSYGYQPIEVMYSKGQRWTAISALIAKPPEWFLFNPDNELRFRTRDNMMQGEELPDRKILLPRNGATYQNPWGVADMAMVFWPATFMRGGLRFWVQFAEKYGTPWLVGKVPRNTHTHIKNQLAYDLEGMIQDAIAVIPDDSSVDIIEAAAKSGAAEAYEKLLMYCRSEINIGLLGQNQTTESNSTNASATAGLEVADDLRDDDKSLFQSTANTLINWLMYANGISGAAPKLELFEQEEVDDKQAKRDEILSRTGVTFSRQYFKKNYDLEDEDFVEEVVPQKVEPEKKQDPVVRVDADVEDPQFAEADHLGTKIKQRQKELAEQLQSEAAKPLNLMIDNARAMVNGAESLEQLLDMLVNGFSVDNVRTMQSVMQTGFVVAHALGIEDVAREAGQNLGSADFAEGDYNFSEQLAALQVRLRTLIPTARWTDIQRNAHDRGFVVAGAMEADLLNDLAQAVKKSIETGGTIDEFRARFDNIIKQHGWEYNGEKNWRTRTIYSTNMSTTYQAGRYAQLTDPDLQSVAPYWMYRHGGSAEPREHHLKWDKTTLPAGDPWFDIHYTPNGWGCSCYVIAVSEATARAMGAKFDRPAADLPGDIDAGWDYAPGSNVANELREIVDSKSIYLDETLTAAYNALIVDNVPLP